MIYSYGLQGKTSNQSAPAAMHLDTLPIPSNYMAMESPPLLAPSQKGQASPKRGRI